ncbi:putative 1-phosphofructokinase [Monocercomonoides exilis]|uniref:putative 1-phosphofructokinase n=1 Tax=Monocercomonoides exilis TaxID=2049356 RepID=UPI003559E813|nr:putative 1-phosphofructokinase [Monocercomonoides exilis]|eukprot:MONOS_5012.1-p1 / transcript=MONOS_5012.1 / gene=MONOS_5012 / organism=Monocercomonoides_exilis_PA203 / gene_product=1-phosphofructokinase / transcript_product=1-phosphofructokinase / location=Mono_scaffold00141:46760-48140(-) / protein_length=315 / sequence_SO=supercontig / SO=protein_coding / is_pseudo=false
MVKPIICVSYNCCVDRTLEVDNFHTGGQNKAIYVSEQAAGKAVNIAYILSYLGLPCAIYGFVGDDCTKLFEKRLYRVTRHLEVLPLRTRVNITLIDKTRKTETHIRESGTKIDESEFTALIDKVVSAGEAGQWVVLSGALPPGIPPRLLGDFVRACKEKRMKVAVDSSGDALREAVQAEPDLIKPNREELKELVGEEKFETYGITQAADRLRYRHPGMDILISDGANGCYFISSQGRKHALFEPEFTVPVLSTIGAGDALLAGYLCGVYENWTIDQCLRYAVRVATSTLPCVCAGDMSKEILYMNPLNVRIDGL